MDASSIIKDLYNPNFYIGHHTCRRAVLDPAAHYHDSFEIYFTLTEGYRFVVNDRVYPFERGDLYVFNQFDIHHNIFSIEDPREIYVVHFNPRFIRDLSTPQADLFQVFSRRGPDFSHRVHPTPKQIRDLTDLFQKAIHYFESNGYGYETYQKIVLAEILLMINIIYQSPEIEQTGLTGGNRETNFDKVGPIIDYVNAHISEDLSLDHLAKTFYLNKDYLGNIFKNATGYTIKEYIMSKRMMLAKQYLLENEPISRVLEKVGFNDYSHFINTFKKKVGVTPKQYIKMS
ncbi:MAG TPA: AraC family transcriptional regulator [Bacillota bacterium]|nr:AraC family transcriptional regulator [Bacillota bacterium]